MHARAKHDVLVVVHPIHDNIVRPHAVGDIVAGEGLGKRQAFGHTALRRDEINFGVAVILPGERDPFAVVREAGEHLEAGMAGQLAGHAPLGIDGVEVAGIGEDQLVAVNRGKTQQPRFALCVRGRLEKQDQ